MSGESLTFKLCKVPDGSSLSQINNLKLEAKIQIHTFSRCILTKELLSDFKSLESVRSFHLASLSSIVLADLFKIRHYCLRN